jgi:hypothetical protein
MFFINIKKRSGVHKWWRANCRVFLFWFKHIRWNKEKEMGVDSDGGQIALLTFCLFVV